MTEPRVEIRGCRSLDELVEVVDLCDAAFLKTPREYFQRHVLRDRTLSPADTRILVKDGTIVSSVQVFPRTMYLEGKTMDMGGIGNVATLPSERGNGYAGMVMDDAIDYVQGKGLPVCLLTTTINAYYEKFGFTTIRRRLMSMNVAGVRKDPRVRTFDRHRDLTNVMRLYEHCNSDSTGPVVRDETYWVSQLDFCGEDRSLFCVYEEGEEILGFVRGVKKADRVQVLEYGVAEHQENIIRSLFEDLAFTAQLHSLELFVSESERPRLSIGESVSSRVDTDLMIRFNTAAPDPGVRGALLADYGVTFWLTDFF